MFTLPPAITTLFFPKCLKELLKWITDFLNLMMELERFWLLGCVNELNFTRIELKNMKITLPW